METYDIVMRSGETFTRTIFLKDSEGAALNLTGYTAKLQAKNSVTLILELSTSNSRIVIDGTLGKLTLTAPSNVTEALVPQTGRYDLRLTSNAGVVSFPLNGQFVVQENISE